jgi:hypothetical protein
LANVGRICTAEEFFRVIPDEIWKSLPEHEIYQSPCYPIIGIRTSTWTNVETGIKNTVRWYYCKLHPKIKNIYLDSIEHHCKYKDPEIHKAKILEFLQSLLQQHMAGHKESTVIY